MQFTVSSDVTTKSVVEVVRNAIDECEPKTLSIDGHSVVFTGGLRQLPVAAATFVLPLSRYSLLDPITRGAVNVEINGGNLLLRYRLNFDRVLLFALIPALIILAFLLWGAFRNQEYPLWPFWIPPALWLFSAAVNYYTTSVRFGNFILDCGERANHRKASVAA
jgi:hypothetical protein